MKIYKVLPDLSNTRQLKLWTKAQRNQWSAEDLDWERPQRMTRDHLKDQLGRVLTPVLMGEQSALYSVSGLIPILGKDSHVEGQFYLTTWAVDEARHTELFTRFYRRLDREPMSIREFPAGYLFQSQIYSPEPAEWLSGVLVSEVLATLVMKEFKRLDLDPVLSDISDGILADESRHLGFNHIYLEDRFADLFEANPDEGRAYAKHLHDHLQSVLDLVPPVFEGLAREFADVGIDCEWMMQEAARDSKERLERSIQGGARRAGKLAEIES